MLARIHSQSNSVGGRSAVRSCMLLICGLLILAAAPAFGLAAEKLPLEYKWEKGRQYAYRVKIEVNMEDYAETMSGVEQYDVTAAEGNSFSLRCSGNLNSVTKSKSRRPFLPPMRMHRHRSPFAGLSGSIAGAFEQHTLELNRYGEIDTVKGSSLLPYLLGHLSQINLIPLSPEGERTWSESEKSSISVISSSNRIPSPLRGPDIEKTMGAKKTSEYKISKQEGDLVTINVEYSYRTISTIDDSGPEVELTGFGLIQFDQKQGCVKDLSVNYKLIQRSENSTQKIPIMLTSTLLNAEELKKYKADQAALIAKHSAEMQKREEAARFEIPENIDDELKTILTELSTSNLLKRKAALQKLSQVKPAEGNRDISGILIGILESKDITVVQDASRALVVWSTKEDIPAMTGLLKEVNILGQESVMEAILQHKTPEGVAAVAELLKEPIKAHNASKKLIEYGSGAEDAVLKQLDPDQFIVLVNVFRVLKEIGTEKSLKKIEEVNQSTTNNSFRFQAASTVKAIEARLN
ncbi:HEAT repeat domain-containing protein [Gimesia sp.]|uniref:HEAT repeat domain-containing protein n=1 Tax=Gimesia sp. TaxID=2024833 RepID=UPI003A931628